jgi:hypothetical protein
MLRRPTCVPLAAAKITLDGLMSTGAHPRHPPDLRLLPERAELARADAEPADALPRRLLQFQLDCAQYVLARAARRKEASETHSFDDLQRLADALCASGGSALAEKIRARFPAALIDEFQDTDPVQAKIFERVYRDADAALFLVGDPKQAIYGFRGADVFTYVGAKRRVGDDTYALDVNRRSGRSLVHAVNALFGSARAPFVLPGIPFFESRPDAPDALAGAAAGRAPLRFLFTARSGGRPLHGGGDQARARRARLVQRRDRWRDHAPAQRRDVYRPAARRPRRRRRAVPQQPAERRRAGAARRPGRAERHVRRHQRVRHPGGGRGRAPHARHGRSRQRRGDRRRPAHAADRPQRRRAGGGARRRTAVGTVGRTLPRLRRTLEGERFRGRVSPPAR